MSELTVTFQGVGKSIKVPKGTGLLGAAVKCGIALHAPCGGEGLCGKCRVIIKSGKYKGGTSGLLADGEKRRGVVLACQTLVENDLICEIPEESLILRNSPSHDAEEFTKGIILKREGIFPLLPIVRKAFIRLPPPTQDDNLSDFDRICRELKREFGAIHISSHLSGIKYLGDVLRDSGFEVTVTLGYKDGEIEILEIEPGDDSRLNFGFAFDIGTTTVVGQLIDMNTGKIIGSRIAFNKQASYGSDVISRIVYSSSNDGLTILNDAVIGNVNEIVSDLIGSNKVSMNDVTAVTFAGNMTMMHLLLKIDPSNIRRAPYIPATTVFPAVLSSELSIEVNPKGLAVFLPGVATYVGGDIVAGILACGLNESDDLSLLVDIGTNGEIVLGNKDWMVGAAASAGPAFEGSGMACGMKAVNGAIQKVEISESLDVKLETIGGVRPKGICGSGYIDLMCQLLKRKVVDKNGKIDRGISSERIRKGESCYEFVLASEGGASGDVVITEDDIENLKRSKGAIYSAIISLLKKVEKDIGEVKKIYIAGGFGNYLNIENSISIGLLPDADRQAYEFVGNSSLAGARMSLLSHQAFMKTYEIYKNITYVDLSSEHDYMDEYIASLFFPHTDMGRFPSVRS